MQNASNLPTVANELPIANILLDRCRKWSWPGSRRALTRGVGRQRSADCVEKLASKIPGCMKLEKLAATIES
jgi:hypothetical protein